jgi:hypothetical protein
LVYPDDILQEVGVNRLAYTKGIEESFLAFELRSKQGTFARLSTSAVVFGAPTA